MPETRTRLPARGRRPRMVAPTLSMDGRMDRRFGGRPVVIVVVVVVFFLLHLFLSFDVSPVMRCWTSTARAVPRAGSTAGPWR